MHFYLDLSTRSIKNIESFLSRERDAILSLSLSLPSKTPARRLRRVLVVVSLTRFEIARISSSKTHALRVSLLAFYAFRLNSGFFMLTF